MRRFWQQLTSRFARKRFAVREEKWAKIRPLFEELEEKIVPAGTAFPTDLLYQHMASIQPLSGPASSSLTPSQIRQAYGVSGISFQGPAGAVAGDGRGETIAIVDAYDDPSIANDLSVFDQQFGLAAPPSFIKVGLNSAGTASTTSFPQADSGWAGEIELDVEWAHAVAPGANIVLVEAYSATNTDLLRAVNYARNYSGVVAVSMSWGEGEFSGEGSYDNYFTTPAGHTGVTFFASSGDNGPPPSWPSISSHVVAVGGTTLSVSSLGAYLGESAWSSGGGGISSYVSQPSYQSGLVIHNGSQTISASGMRVVPDVSWDADPNSGLAVYGSYGWNGWAQVGGTSASAPEWAGIMAMVDQGYALSHPSSSLDGYTQSLPALYKLPSGDFHDVTSGSNGYAAGTGFDLATGRGTPVSNLLVPALAGTSTAQPPSFTTPAHLVSSTATTASLNALGTDPAGSASLTYTWRAVGTPPAPVTFSVNGTNGAQNTVATFSKVGAYTVQVTITDTAGLSATSQIAYTVSPVLTSVGVSPASTSVADGGTRQFTATGNDQFGAALASQPVFTWSIATGGLGTISTTGLYAAPVSGSGSATIQAGSGGYTGTATANFSAISGPTITTPAQITIQTPAAATLTVGANDPGGASTLKYTWTLLGTPPAAVTFSANGTNAAQTTTATFAGLGTYKFQVAVTDANNLSATSTVTVTVSAVLTSITVTPGTVTLKSGGTQQFAASGRDQFGNALVSQPAITWSVTGAGTISSTGLFTAGTSGGTVVAAAGNLRGQAAVSIQSSSVTFTWSSYVLIYPYTVSYGLLNVNQDITIGSLTTGLNVSFPYDGDLVIDLISPQGTDVTLSHYAGGYGSNFQNTTFSDGAATPIANGYAPFSGSYKPATPLAAFAGLNARGTWEMAISNYSFYVYGSLNSFSITVQAQAQALSAAAVSASTPGMSVISNMPVNFLTASPLSAPGVQPDQLSSAAVTPSAAANPFQPALASSSAAPTIHARLSLMNTVWNDGTEWSAVSQSVFDFDSALLPDHLLDLISG